jgi:hypothetical protein
METYTNRYSQPTTIKIPVFIVVGLYESHYKPNRILFDLFIQSVNKSDELLHFNESFHV